MLIVQSLPELLNKRLPCDACGETTLRLINCDAHLCEKCGFCYTGKQRRMAERAGNEAWLADLVAEHRAKSSQPPV